MKRRLTALILGATALGACAETPALPPESPQNPASSKVAEGEPKTTSVFATALPPPVVGKKGSGPGAAEPSKVPNPKVKEPTKGGVEP